jgi:hypothetical protein
VLPPVFFIPVKINPANPHDFLQRLIDYLNILFPPNRGSCTIIDARAYGIEIISLSGSHDAVAIKSCSITINTKAFGTRSITIGAYTEVACRLEISAKVDGTGTGSRVAGITINAPAGTAPGITIDPAAG